MVEDVEHLGAEVQRLGLPNANCLKREKSQLTSLGPISVFLQDYPIVPRAAAQTRLRRTSAWDRRGSDCWTRLAGRSAL